MSTTALMLAVETHGSAPQLSAADTPPASAAQAAGANAHRFDLARVPVVLIDADSNVRTCRDADLFYALVDSVHDAGCIIQPGIARPYQAADGTIRFQLVAGHRRFDAALANGHETFPVLVAAADMTDADMVAWALTENENREPLNPIDQARQFKKLILLGWSQARIARHLGLKSNGRVSEYLKLLDLPEDVQQRVASGELSAKQAVRGRRRPRRKEPRLPTRQADHLVWDDPVTGVMIHVSTRSGARPSWAQVVDALERASSWARIRDVIDATLP